MSKYTDILYVRVTDKSKEMLSVIKEQYLMKPSDYVRLAITNQLIADGLFPIGRQISTNFKHLREPSER